MSPTVQRQWSGENKQGFLHRAQGALERTGETKCPACYKGGGPEKSTPLPKLVNVGALGDSINSPLPPPSSEPVEKTDKENPQMEIKMSAILLIRARLKYMG